MKKYILAIDQGTSSSKALLFDSDDFSIVAQASKSFKQYYPEPSWVEHDLSEIWNSIVVATENAIANAQSVISTFSAKDIVCIGITNQRETLAIWDRDDNSPLARAIVWQCRRSVEVCEQIFTEALNKRIAKKTGLVIDPYFTGTKIAWVLQNDHHLKTKINNSQVNIGTIDSFIVSMLTGGKSFVTEPSNASRTLLYHLDDLKQWDSNLIKMFGLKNTDALAQIIDSDGLFGKTHGLGFLPDGIPITGILGDQQASALGQQCLTYGQSKCTYGTGAFLLLNIGNKYIVDTEDTLLTTIGWSVGKSTNYMLEGSSYIAGAGVEFLQKNLQLIDDVSELNKIKGDSAAPLIYFVPALSGLGAPYWDSRSRGAIFGLTRSTDKSQILTALLEGVAFSLGDLIVCAGEFVEDISSISVDGGMTNNDYMLQFQADICNLSIIKATTLQSTGLGAAIIAAHGAGIISDLEIKLSDDKKVIFNPGIDSVRRSELFEGWKRAVRAVRVFSSSD